MVQRHLETLPWQNKYLKNNERKGFGLLLQTKSFFDRISHSILMSKYKNFISQKVLVDLCDYSYFSIHVNEGILSQS